MMKGSAVDLSVGKGSRFVVGRGLIGVRGLVPFQRR